MKPKFKKAQYVDMASQLEILDYLIECEISDVYLDLPTPPEIRNDYTISPSAARSYFMKRGKNLTRTLAEFEASLSESLKHRIKESKSFNSWKALYLVA